jgi:hypothetical protein
MRHRRHHRRHHRRDEMLSESDMSHLRDTLEDAHRYVARDEPRSHADLKTEAVDGGEVFVGTLLNGYLSSRYENFFHPGGTKVPLDLVGGLAVMYGAYKGVFGKASGHVGRVAAGVAYGYGFKLGASMGTGQRTAQNLAPLAITAGGLVGCPTCPTPQLAPGAYGGPTGMTEAEMAAYSRGY